MPETKVQPMRISFASRGLYTTAEAAEYLGMGIGYLNKLSCDRHTIPYMILGSKTRLYKQADLDAYLASRKKDPEPAAATS